MPCRPPTSAMGGRPWMGGWFFPESVGVIYIYRYLQHSLMFLLKASAFTCIGAIDIVVFFFFFKLVFMSILGFVSAHRQFALSIQSHERWLENFGTVTRSRKKLLTSLDWNER